MPVQLCSAGPGGVRAVAIRHGLPFVRAYLGADTPAEPLGRDDWPEVPLGPADEATPFPGSAFCGWYRLPRLGLSAVYNAVERPRPAPAAG